MITRDFVVFVLLLLSFYAHLKLCFMAVLESRALLSRAVILLHLSMTKLKRSSENFEDRANLRKKLFGRPRRRRQSFCDQRRAVADQN